MIWVSWQQHRMLVLVAGIVLALLVPLLLISGLDVISVYQTVLPCLTTHTQCSDVIPGFTFYVQISPVLLLLRSFPLLVGIFVGAPLVTREVEEGTHLLVWTQGITRQQWFVRKLGFLVSLTLLLFILPVLLMVWWSHPITLALGPWLTFDVYGIVPFAYALFALVLGSAVGTWIRKTVPAMAITLGVFIATRLVVGLLLRWPSSPPSASQFWVFQGIEALLFLALSLLLLLFTWWWTKHRI